MGGGKGSGAAAVLWDAAAVAMVWAASIRDHAAWVEVKGAWATMAEAVDAMRAGAEECGRAVDAQGKVDAAALGRAGESMKRAGGIIERAADAFGRSSELCEAAGAGQKRAGEAHARASNVSNGADARRMAARSYKRADSTAKMAAKVRAIAGGLAREAGGMAAEAASDHEGSGRRMRRGERSGLAAVQADLWEDTRDMRANSAEMLRQSSEAVKVAARIRAVAGMAAERLAGRAAMACRDGAPDAQEAAAAWRGAVADANRADAEGGGR